MANETALNIYQKLSKVRKAVEVLQKNADGYGYKYVTEESILAPLTAQMDKYGLTLIPEIVPGTFTVEPYVYSKTKRDKNGNTWEEVNNEIIVRADMSFRWINNDNPSEVITVPWSMVGHQTDGSQGFGTALSYSYRYFLLKYFGIATPQDDPDAWRSKQREAAESEDKTVAEGIIQELDTMVQDFVSAHGDRRDELLSFIKTYVASGNYKKIKNPALAGKLMTEFREKFMKSDAAAS